MALHARRDLSEAIQRPGQVQEQLSLDTKRERLVQKRLSLAVLPAVHRQEGEDLFAQRDSLT
jgi:hypothetical protein